MMSKILMQLAIVLGVPMRKICQGKAKQSHSYTQYFVRLLSAYREAFQGEKDADFNGIFFGLFFPMFSFLFGTNKQWEIVHTTVAMEQDSKFFLGLNFSLFFFWNKAILPNNELKRKKKLRNFLFNSLFNAQTNQHFIVFGTSYYRASSSRTFGCTFLQKEK